MLRLIPICILENLLENWICIKGFVSLFIYYFLIVELESFPTDTAGVQQMVTQMEKLMYFI